jgi:aminoglycoside phosphotransferase (APT) family kinase protein
VTEAAPRRDEAERVRGGLEAFLSAAVGNTVAVVRLDRLPGGTMRDVWALDVDLPEGRSTERHRLVYLMDRDTTLSEARQSRGDEFLALVAMHRAGVRVPRPYWRIDTPAPDGLGPGLILERIEGETVARRIVGDPSLEAIRPRLVEQMGQELARIHAVKDVPIGRLAGAAAGQSPAEAQIARIERSLDEAGEPHPALELGLRWLKRRRPRCESLGVVHGDYRLGNIVVDPREGLRAILDWELAHLGHPGEDLGWVVMRFWRCFDRPGLRGLGSADRFLEAYAAAGGARLDGEDQRFWEVLANTRWAVITLAQARRHLTGGERDLELASIGRRCAEVEWELLRLLDRP